MRQRLRFLRMVARTALAADRRAVVFVVCLALVNSMAVAVSAASLRWLVDTSRVGVLGGIALAAAVGGLAYALIAAVQRVQHNLQVDLTERIDLVLSQDVFAAAARIPTVEHLERADYLDRLGQLRRSTESLAEIGWHLLGTATALVSLTLSVVLLAAVHPALILLAVLAAPPLVSSRFASRLISRASTRAAADVRREERLHRLCIEPEPAKEIRISGTATELSRRADDAWSSVTATLARARAGAALWQAAGWMLFSAGFIGGLALVAYLVAHGRGTVGSLVLVSSLAGYLRGQLGATVAGVTKVAEANHAMTQYLWLMSYADERRPHGTAPAPERLTQGLTLSRVTFRYPGTDRAALDNVDVVLPAGKVVAVVGVNGAGKTTLVKLLTGLYEPTAGNVLVDGRPLTELDPAQWRRASTGAFQDFAKFQVRVRETVGAGDVTGADDDRVWRAVRGAGAEPLVQGFPDGLDTQLGEVFDGARLSHGQWQKLALARSMLRETPLLAVLDEPTAALDPQAEHDLYERFVGTARTGLLESGGIVLLVSHRFSTVSMADHIIVLADGAVAEQGTHADLMARGGSYAELYAAHAKGYA